MAVGQREMDLMTLSAQLRIMKMVEEWRRQFLGGRFNQQVPQSPVEEPMTSTAAPQEEISY